MFIKRLGYFLVGLSLGLVFLTFFFKKKSDETGVSFCYLPNCRVLKDLRSKPMYYSNEVSEMFVNGKIDTVLIKEIFLEGNIDFGKSDTKSTPCRTYYIDHELNKKMIQVKVENCPNKATIISLD